MKNVVVVTQHVNWEDDGGDHDPAPRWDRPTGQDERMPESHAALHPARGV